MAAGRRRPRAASGNPKSALSGAPRSRRRAKQWPGGRWNAHHRHCRRARQMPRPWSWPRALPRAGDDHPDIVEGRCDRSLRLAHGDTNAANLRKAVEHGVRDCAGSGLDQAIASRAKRLARCLHQCFIRNRMFERVGARGLGEIDVGHEIELERLSDLGFVRHDAVVGVENEAIDENRVAHRAPLIAEATASACAVAATSWVRTIVAPFPTASRCAASDPPRRSMGSEGATEWIKRLREAPTRSGAPKPRQASSRAMQVKLCSAVLPKPMP